MGNPTKYYQPVDHTEQDERELDRLQRDIASGKIAPPEVRLAEQLREMFNKWDRHLIINSHHRDVQ